MFCEKCGKPLVDGSSFCENCGARLKVVQATAVSTRTDRVTAWLALFLGYLGFHDFYAGRFIKGIVKVVLTLTMIGAVVSWIWTLHDLYLLSKGRFVDGDGAIIQKKTQDSTICFWVHLAFFILFLIIEIIILVTVVPLILGLISGLTTASVAVGTAATAVTGTAAIIGETASTIGDATNSIANTVSSQETSSFIDRIISLLESIFGK